MNGVLYFADNSRLEFTERVVIRGYHPFKERYRYQYLRDDETVFRYDNAPHHLHLPTFPHHKHGRDTVVASSEPTLQQVLAEIAEKKITGLVHLSGAYDISYAQWGFYLADRLKVNQNLIQPCSIFASIKDLNPWELPKFTSLDIEASKKFLNVRALCFKEVADKLCF